MINLEFNDPPVRPAVEGRHELPNGGMFFTIGREHVAETAFNLLRRRDTLACDIETFGLANLRFRIKTVTFADDVDAVILDPRDPYQADIVRKMVKHLKGIIIHNSPYDIPCMYQRDLLDKEDIYKVIDTIITSRQGSPGEMTRHSLEALVKKYFGMEAEKRIAKDEFYSIDLHSIKFLHGAALDALYTYKLYPVLMKEVESRYSIEPYIKGQSLNKSEKEYIINREQRVNHVLLKPMSRGLNVDLDEVDKYETNIRPQENRFELIMKQYGMKTFTNRNQLVSALERDNAFPATYKRTAGGGPSTAKEDLKNIEHPLAQAFRGHSEIQKVRQYLNTIADESYMSNRVFPSTNILAATSGRMSLSNPPLHQFTPAARGVIIPEEGDLFSSIDWSQVEPTLLFYLSDDQMALHQYENEGTDFYTIVGNITSIPRKDAKTTLLAQMYGQGIAALSKSLNVSESQAREFKSRIFSAMPNVQGFIEGMKQIGETRYVHTLMGRVLDVETYNGVVKAYKATNQMLQGSAYDLLAEVLVKVDEAGLSDGVYMTVHDELIVSSSHAEDIAAIMRKPPERVTELLGREMILKAEPALLGDRWGKI